MIATTSPTQVATRSTRCSPPSVTTSTASSDDQSFSPLQILFAGLSAQFQISFEVFADDFPTMMAQGRTIASWGRNVNVKVPVANTKGDFAGSVIGTLSGEGVMLNVTAIMTIGQVRAVAEALDPSTPAIVSVFSGRIADTGRDPIPHMRACKEALASRPKAELLWASPREHLSGR
jgi:transaldolase